MNILIVDDDRICTLLLSAQLTPYGDCQVAGDGGTAVRLFTAAMLLRQPFDLVCLDILMPTLDGQATLRCLRAVEAGFGCLGHQAASILMISTRGDPENIVSAFRGQCEGYLAKPFADELLAARLSDLGFEPLVRGDHRGSLARPSGRALVVGA